MARTDQGPSRFVIGTVSGIGIGVAIGGVVMLLTNDVILGVMAGSAAITVGLIRLWTGGGSPRSHHP